jgi:hypothetical protein
VKEQLGQLGTGELVRRDMKFWEELLTVPLQVFRYMAKLAGTIR